MVQRSTCTLKVQGVFNLLDDRIKKALLKRGFIKPTEPQEKAIPLILKGENVLLIAPTGTGKTEAAFLPIFHNFLRLRDREKIVPGIYILYITPLRALNRDLLDRLMWWSEELDISVAVRHGDTEVRERTHQAKNPPNLLITTPETLQAILSGRVMRSHLSKVKWVIVDEIHELAEDKRGSQLVLGLERLSYIKSINGEDPHFQRVGLSATVGSPNEIARFLVGKDRKVTVVQVPVARMMKLKVVYPQYTQEDVELSTKLYTHPEVVARLRLIKELIENHKSTLIFVNTRAIAEVLSSRFNVWNIDLPIGVHHGSLAKPSRIMAEKGLKEGKLKALIATSSLELGIDIGHIDLVIQYMSPRQVTRLVQRVGRSGHRIGGVAKGIIITADEDDTLEAIVICRKALNEELEPVIIPEKPLDVLTHQIVALLMLRGRWKFDEILTIYRRAYPYRDLSKNDLLFVLRYMHSRYPRLAWISERDEVILRPRNRDFYRYFFEELSMIPDERHYLVIDETTNTPIGLLDEAFVAEYGEPGVKFVFRGSLWIIKNITGDKIYVTPTKDPTGAIPSWVGEEIPVPFEVAMEVGEIKRKVSNLLDTGKSLDTIVEDLCKTYPIDKKSLLRALYPIKEQKEKGFIVPSDKVALIESWENLVVIHVHLGLLGNRALGKLIAEILTSRIGSAVGVQQDAYRIVFQLPTHMSSQEIKDVILSLSNLSEKEIMDLIIKAAIKSGMFKRRIIHVARRFGALKKSISFADISLRKLVEMFKGTPIFEEALKEFLLKDVDVKPVRWFFTELKAGKIAIANMDTKIPSPITKLALEKIARKTELIPADRMKRIIIESTRARLLNESRFLVCTENWDWYDIVKVKDLSDKPSCPLCGSKKLAFLDVDLKDIERLVKLKGRARSKSDRALLKRIVENADLVAKYGKKAIIALAAKGVRPKDLVNLLEEYSNKPIDNNFFLKIAELEKEALKRRFF